MLKEFKEFAIKGNMLDLAIGVVLGAAFGKIVDSLVNDLIMPPLGLITGGIDFKAQQIVLKAAEGEKPAVALNYGSFLSTAIQFIIVAFALFLIVKAMNSMRRKSEAAPVEPPAPPRQEVLLEEIRDLLKK
jgi:large conductance mechanosensitive channel